MCTTEIFTRKFIIFVGGLTFPLVGIIFLGKEEPKNTHNICSQTTFFFCQVNDSLTKKKRWSGCMRLHTISLWISLRTLRSVYLQPYEYNIMSKCCNQIVAACIETRLLVWYWIHSHAYLSCEFLNVCNVICYVATSQVMEFYFLSNAFIASLNRL